MLPSNDFLTIADRLPCRAGRYFPGLYSLTAHGAARRRGESGLPSAGNFPRCFLLTLTLIYPNTAGVSRGPRESGQRRLL